MKNNSSIYSSEILLFEKILDISLDCKPVSTNKMYGISRISKKGEKHLFLSKEAEEYQNKIINAIGFVSEQIDSSVKVEIDVYKKTSVRYDLDNCAKPILDAITKSKFWTDDYLVVDLHMKKFKCDEDKINIKIYRINDISGDSCV